jgi:predicted dehydrogenase
VNAGRPARLGVIGAGRWGRNIIQTLRELPAAEIAWVASRNPATRDLAPPDCPIDEDWRDLVQHRSPDGVIVATPPALHAEMTAAALSAGVPVFVEKPLTCDIGEAERLLDLAAAKGGYVLVDHVHLFSHAYRRLKEHLPAIVPIERLQTEAGAWGPFRADASVLWDWGPHDAAFCIDLLGALPRTVSARRQGRRSVGGAWGETLALQADYPDGAHVDIRLSNVLDGRRRRLRVEGRSGFLVYDDCAACKLAFSPRGREDATAVDVPYEPPLACALGRFIANITTGRMNVRDLEFGVEVVRLLAVWQAHLG